MLVLGLKKQKNKIVIGTSDGKVEIFLGEQSLCEQAKIGIVAPKTVNIYRELQR